MHVQVLTPDLVLIWPLKQVTLIRAIVSLLVANVFLYLVCTIPPSNFRYALVYIQRYELARLPFSTVFAPYI